MDIPSARASLAKTDVVIRANTSRAIGTGHAFRSATLASAFAAEGKSVILLGNGLRRLAPLLNVDAKVRIMETSETLESSADVAGIVALQPSLIVVDGYEFNEKFFRLLDSVEVPYAVFDDNGESCATNPSALINQNVLSPLSAYARFGASTEFLLGPEFAQVRPTIRKLVKEGNSPFGPVLVSLGGSDPRDFTKGVVSELVALDIPLAIAQGCERREKLAADWSDNPRLSIVEPNMFPAALNSARCAVLAAGTSVWEAATLGVPVVALTLFDNQVSVAQTALELGAAAAIIDCRKVNTPAEVGAQLRHELTCLLRTKRYDRVPLKIGTRSVALALKRHFASGTDSHQRRLDT